MRVSDGVGGWYTPAMRHFTDKDVPIGFADSSVFDPATLRQMKNEKYRFFGAMSKDTADIMKLKKTVVIGGAYDPTILQYPRLSIREALKLPEGKIVYINGTNYPFRRGVDLALQAVIKLQNEGYEIIPVLREWNQVRLPPEFTPKNLFQLIGLVSPEEHYGYMKDIDVMLAPVRGGGFELQILEAFVLGRQVVMPDKGAWTDIPLSPADVHYCKAGQRNFPIIGSDYDEKGYHSGYMYAGNVDSVTQALRDALNHPVNMEERAKEYQKHYHPDRFAERILAGWNR
ncbi:MAG: hypothetical protein QXL94_03340 [Candidatus Parvarchaeum sp.]